MADLAYLALIVALFGLAVLLLEACKRIVGSDEVDR